MIVPVKKATLVVLREDRDAVTAALQRCGEFMPLPVGDDPSPGQRVGTYTCMYRIRSGGS